MISVANEKKRSLKIISFQPPQVFLLPEASIKTLETCHKLPWNFQHGAGHGWLRGATAAGVEVGWKVSVAKGAM